MQVVHASKRALLLLLACVLNHNACASGLLIAEPSSSVVPAELSAWRQLEQQRYGRLSALLRELGAASSGPSASAISSKLAWYVSSQRPLSAAQDMQQLLKANRQAAAATAVPEEGLLYVGHDLYDFSSSGSIDKETGNQMQSMIGPDREPLMLLHTLHGSVAYQDDFSSSSSSSSDDEDFAGFADAYAQQQPAASRRMLSTAASSRSSASDTAVFNIPGISGGAGSGSTWSTVSELANSLGTYRDLHIAQLAAQAAAAVMPARAGQIPTQQDFRIIGGAEAPKDRYDWMCSMRGNNDFHYCGCSLIAPGVVMSAGHCLDQTDSVLKLPWIEIGRYYLAGANTSSNSYERIKCTNSVVHPGWSAKNGRNDISLCFLATPTRFEPVTLAKNGQTPEIGTPVVVMGWGSQEEGATNAPSLMEVTVETSSLAACNQTYKGQVRSTQICAGVPQGGADACQGDSGGPLILRGDTPADDMQIGIVSYGVGCGRPNTPGVYTDVSQFRGFIAQTLAANGVTYEPLTGGVSTPTAVASQGATTDTSTTPTIPTATTATSSSSSSRDPCACSTDGYSGKKFVGLALTGCKQHGLDFGDNSFYCYVQAGADCAAATASNAYQGATWLNCTPSDNATTSAVQSSATDSSASGVVPGPGVGIADELNALQSWDWMFNIANNVSSSGSNNSANSTSTGALQAEPPAVAAAAHGP